MFSYTLAQSLIPFFGKYGELFQGLAGIEGCLRASGSVKPDSRVLVIIDWVLVIILELGCCPYGVCSGGCAVAGLSLFPCMHVYRSLHNAYIKTPPSICGPLIVRAPPPTSARFSAINNHARLSPSFITKPQTRPHNGSLHSFSPASRTHSLTHTHTHTQANPVYIVSASRTPVGAKDGALATLSAPQLGVVAVKHAVDRAGIKPEQVEELYMGNVVQAGVGQSPARQVGIGAGCVVFFLLSSSSFFFFWARAC